MMSYPKIVRVKRSSLICLIALVLFIAYFIGVANAASAPVTQWQKNYGGNLSDYESYAGQTSDGGYIMVGSTNSYSMPSGRTYKGLAGYTSPVITNDIYLVKTDAAGNQVWAKTYGGPGDELGSCVKQTSDGGYIIVGSTDSFGKGMNDIYLIKTDKYGNVQWNKTYGGSGEDFGIFVQQTPDGGYIVTGNTYSYGNNDCTIFLLKTNMNGDTQWFKTYSGGIGNCVIVSSDGGYVVTGYTGTNTSEEVGLVFKTDTSGNIVWQKLYNDSSIGYDIKQTSDGGYVFVGQVDTHKDTNGNLVTGSQGLSAISLIKTDALGNQIWNKTFASNRYEWGYGVCQTTDSGYILVGTYDNPTSKLDVLVIKTDPRGNVLWNKSYGGNMPDMGVSIQQTKDGGYIIGGWTDSIAAGGQGSFYPDFYLIKLAPESTTPTPTPLPVQSHPQSYPNMIKGIIYNDLNHNKKYDLSDSRMPGVTINIYNQGGSLVTHLITDHNGYYQAQNLTPGIYRVVETVPTGYTSDTPTSIAVTIANNTIAQAAFGNIK